MQMGNIHMTIAIDEYGGTDGVVTIEDAIEEIVGNIFDEYDDPGMDEEEIIELNNNEYLIPGTTNLYVVEELLSIDLQTEEFDTLSGFVIGQLGYIPNEDENPEIHFENIRFIVEKMDDKRILQLRAIVLEDMEESD